MCPYCGCETWRNSWDGGNAQCADCHGKFDIVFVDGQITSKPCLKRIVHDDQTVIIDSTPGPIEERDFNREHQNVPWTSEEDPPNGLWTPGPDDEDPPQSKLWVPD